MTQVFDRENFIEFYNDLTYDEKNGKGFAPYEYQIKVAELFAAGKNVILSVPTGAGKTWASIMPFLFADKYGDFSFPKKMIYSLPLRALANSIYLDVRDALKKNDYSNEDIERQTGEFANDKNFEKKMIFSTIDQTLSNYCSFPLALSQRQANVNAGSVIGSYLIFDEFHLLTPCLSMATTLGMLKTLKNLSRYCIMTATLSEEFIAFIKNKFPELDFEIVTLKDFPEDAKKIKSLLPPSGRKDKKEVHVIDGALDEKIIVEKHKSRTIVICNRVETAQSIFVKIKAELKTKGKQTQVLCIHSRFFDKDRKEKEKELKRLLGKKTDPQDVDLILVATQVIEAGMNISSEVMHTEISPANSFLQRIGRNARFAGEFGDVYVYDPTELSEEEKVNEELGKNQTDKAQIQRLNRLYLPYEREICEKTKAALKEEEFRFIDEKSGEKLVNRIMEVVEKENVETMTTGQFNGSQIFAAWADCSKSNYGKLVRDIQSISLILINDTKEEEDKVLRSPWYFESVSMYRWSFIKWINDIYKNEDFEEEEWVIKKLGENQIIGFEEEGDEVTYQLERLDTDALKTHYDLTFLNTKFFSYDSEVGLRLGRGKENSPKMPWKEKETFDTVYKKDTFVEHNMALLGAFEKQFLASGQLDYALDRLGDFLNQPDLSKEKLKDVIRLMIIFHDYGKLNIPWQRWMQDLQKAKSERDPEFIFVKDEPLGHTDFDKEKDDDLDKAIFKKHGKRPPHSGVGALAIRDILDKEFGNPYLTNAVSLAIARHHGISNTGYKDFKISETNFKVMNDLFKEVGFEIDADEVIREEDEGDLDFRDTAEEYIPYFFFVRILRMCDQMATADFKKWI